MSTLEMVDLAGTKTRTGRREKIGRVLGHGKTAERRRRRVAASDR